MEVATNNKKRATTSSIMVYDGSCCEPVAAGSFLYGLL